MFVVTVYNNYGFTDIHRTNSRAVAEKIAKKYSRFFSRFSRTVTINCIIGGEVIDRKDWPDKQAFVFPECETVVPERLCFDESPRKGNGRARCRRRPHKIARRNARSLCS
jgi:hypothetical protein